MNHRTLPRLHVVTDDWVLRRGDFVALAGEILERGGARVALHLRGPGSGGGLLFGLTTALAPVARSAGARLLVNDRLDVALAAGVDGVHLGQRSLPVRTARSLLPDGALVGVSTHDDEEVSDAAGADFVFMGSVYETPSHPGTPGLGPAAVTGASSCGMPTVAIGGVTPDRVEEIRAAGAHGVAVVGGVWNAPHPLDAVMRYLDALNRTTGDA